MGLENKVKNMKKKVTANTVLYIAIILAIVIVGAILCGCTEHGKARKWGGQMTITLPKGQKLLEATWKEASLWYLTEPMDSGYVPKTKTFREDSRFGVFEGEITFVESR